MKKIRRRAIAKSVKSKYYIRQDGCIIFSKKHSDLYVIYESWYPSFPYKNFKNLVKQAESIEQQIRAI